MGTTLIVPYSMPVGELCAGAAGQGREQAQRAFACGERYS
jgi:hypothetical protein